MILTFQSKQHAPFAVGPQACPRHYTSDPKVVAFVQNPSETDLRGHGCNREVVEARAAEGPLRRPPRRESRPAALVTEVCVCVRQSVNV